MSRRIVGFLACVIALIAALLPASPGTAELADRAPLAAKIAGLSPALGALAGESGVDDILARVPDSGPGSLVHDAGERVIVDVTVADGAPGALASIEATGADVIAMDSGQTLVTVAVPIGSLLALAALPVVEYVTQVPAPVNNGLLGGAPSQAGVCPTGIVTEGDTQLRAATARSNFGVDGGGVVVGVLSDSYDNRSGATNDVQDAELPGSANPCGRLTPVGIQSDLDDGGSDEGRAMAQIVHDLAPGAELRFAGAFRGELDMARQITQLGQGGVDVITDDIFYLSEPMFQDGPIAVAINENRTLRDIPHFTSAGNSNVVIAGRDVASYEAPAFRPSACPIAVTTFDPLYNACHDFDTGAVTDSGNGLTLENGGSITLALGWSEPLYGVDTDLDVFIVDTMTGELVAGSAFPNDRTNRPAEFTQYTNDTNDTDSSRTFDIVVARYGDAPDPSGTPRLKHVLVRSSGLTAVEYDRSVGGDVVGPTLVGHSSAQLATGVAAVRYSNADRAERFSSRGPGASCWRPDDAASPQPAITPCVPVDVDLAATDGGANSFFGQSDSGGTFRFFGTSAAAPHAAAVAALAREAVPCATAAQVEAAMTDTAVTVGSETEEDVGAGLVDAAQTLASLDASVSGCERPTISAIADRVVDVDEAVPPIDFSVDDVDDAASSLDVVATSNNPSVIANSSLAISGSARTRTLTIDPAPSAAGSTTVTVVVTDPAGLSSSTSFSVTVRPAAPEDGDDDDRDDDGIPDSSDNCPGIANSGQADIDGDGIGDLCDGTDDRDGFTSLTPARFADSRDEPTFDGRFRNTGPRPAGTTWEIEVAGRGSVPADAKAAIVNLTALGADAPGFATVYPCGTLPNASSVNYGPGDVEPNEVIAKLSRRGTICVFVLSTAHVIADVVGFAAADSPFVPLVPQRYADSRAERTFDGRFVNTGARPGGTTWSIDVAGRGAVPSSATTVVANITVTNGAGPGFATVYPCGALPTASSLNYGLGVTRPNEVVARLSSSGTLCVYTLTDVDVIVDISGYG